MKNTERNSKIRKQIASCKNKKSMHFHIFCKLFQQLIIYFATNLAGLEAKTYTSTPPNFSPSCDPAGCIQIFWQISTSFKDSLCNLSKTIWLVRKLVSELIIGFRKKNIYCRAVSELIIRKGQLVIQGLLKRRFCFKFFWGKTWNFKSSDPLIKK